MEIEKERVEAFKAEIQRFLAEMKKELFKSQLESQVKEQLYNNLIVECKNLNLEKMQMEDQRRKEPISINNSQDLLMAVGTYYTKIRNMFIKQFQSFQHPFCTIISTHEKKVAKILKGYI